MKSLWTREAKLFEVPDDHPWWMSSAQAPFVHKLAPDLWRIHFWARDYDNRARGVFIDVNPLDGMRQIALNDKPALMPRVEAGLADKDGVALTCLVEHEGRLLGYTGEVYRLDEAGVFSSTIGIVSTEDDGLSFARIAEAPIVGETDFAEPDLNMTGHVLKRHDRWHMWFAKLVRWDKKTGAAPEYYYDLRHAQSEDGLRWTISPQPAIPLAEGECGMTRPWVQETDEGDLEMWFCVRGPYDAEHPERRFYRIGYARSADGIHWDRQDDEHGFTNPPAADEWDGEQACYPSVFKDEDGRQYLLYSGNDFGRHAFGYAVREP